jgi:hypothetical protein
LSSYITVIERVSVGGGKNDSTPALKDFSLVVLKATGDQREGLSNGPAR